MASYKFGKRESDALFDLSRTLGLSNEDEPVTYLKTIKEAHKEIIELRGRIELLTAIRGDQSTSTEDSEFEKWREKKFGRLGRRMFDI